MKRGDRVSWTYQGKRTYGVVTSIGGKRATIKSPTGGTVTRVGSDTTRSCGSNPNPPATP